jgi:hypothetical protein
MIETFKMSFGFPDLLKKNFSRKPALLRKLKNLRRKNKKGTLLTKKQISRLLCTD